jgi:type IV pilus assembly protein PilM
LISRATASPAAPAGNPLARLLRWLGNPPHPQLVCEIGAGGVAGARLAARGRRSLESHVFEPLPTGAVAPSPVELNLADAGAVGSALDRVLSRVNGHGSDFALIIPDEVVRVFLLQFESFPKSAVEAVPLLRFRLRKSVPFETDESSVSYSIQPAGPPSAPAGAVHVLAAIARQKIIRQYEELLEARQKRVGVVLSSTLAALPLVDDSRPSLLARLTGNTLTTVIVRSGALAVYRCTPLHGSAETVAAKSLLDEIYPAVAYFQDTWGEAVAEARMAGFGTRLEEFREPLENELHCRISPVVASAALEGRLAGEERAQVDRAMEAAVGWMLHGQG